MILNLIPSPRNVSTAFMYSFGQRKDTKCLDEPFYACYLKETGKHHPGREKIMKSLSSNREDIYHWIRSTNAPLVFVKNMAHHIVEKDFISNPEWKHCFLIRHPKLLIRSFTKVIEKPAIEDLGITAQRNWFDYLNQQNNKPYILDSNDLLLNPEIELKNLCHFFNIPFTPSMLTWPPGPKSYDGTWAPYWYNGVHKSTGFKPPSDIESAQFPKELQYLLYKCLEDYLYLKNQTK